MWKRSISQPCRNSAAQRTQFDRIKASDLEGEYVLTFLFLVDPGVKIVSFSTGGDATRSDDLSPDNLVATIGVNGRTPPGRRRS